MFNNSKIIVQIFLFRNVNIYKKNLYWLTIYSDKGGCVLVQNKVYITSGIRIFLKLYTNIEM